MTNGNITLVRILASTLITLATLGCSVWLLLYNHPIPQVFWVVEIAGVSGVVGVDVVASIIGRVAK
jgi:hypothetical protein